MGGLGRDAAGHLAAATVTPSEGPSDLSGVASDDPRPVPWRPVMPGVGVE